jgi:hypothetical protein
MLFRQANGWKRREAADKTMSHACPLSAQKRQRTRRGRMVRPVAIGDHPSWPLTTAEQALGKVFP